MTELPNIIVVSRKDVVLGIKYLDKMKKKSFSYLKFRVLETLQK